MIGKQVHKTGGVKPQPLWLCIILASFSHDSQDMGVKPPATLVVHHTVSGGSQAAGVEPPATWWRVILFSRLNL